jgi:predicted RNase H-like HicB family nuclease
MANFENIDVTDFGKVIFVPRNHTIPGLPDMNLIVLKKEGIYQAICIDIEIDAVGDTLKNACENLKKTLLVYLGQMVSNYNGDLKAVVKDIVNMAFSSGDLKQQLFAQYIQAKHRYLLDKIARDNKAKSRGEEFLNACKRAFQIQPIQFNLTVAAVIA